MLIFLWSKPTISFGVFNGKQSPSILKEEFLFAFGVINTTWAFKLKYLLQRNV